MNRKMNLLIEECENTVRSLGYRFPKIIYGVSQAKRRLGLAKLRENKILLSKFVTEQSDEDKIKSVIYHEIAHFVASPRAKHGPEWQKIVKDITDHTGVKITRVTNISNFEHVAKYKYEFTCTKCGVTGRRYRLFQYTKNEDGTVSFVNRCCARCGKGQNRWILKANY